MTSLPSVLDSLFVVGGLILTSAAAQEGIEVSYAKDEEKALHAGLSGALGVSGLGMMGYGHLRRRRRYVRHRQYADNT